MAAKERKDYVNLFCQLEYEHVTLIMVMVFINPHGKGHGLSFKRWALWVLIIIIIIITNKRSRPMCVALGVYVVWWGDMMVA